MKSFLLAVAICSSAFAAGLGGAKTVYVMPMANGLDQYLAVRLTTESVLQVVTDPQKADVVFTDHVGQGFEESLAELSGSKPASTKSDESAEVFARVGTHGLRGRGAAFLVDRKTHDILWSVYERPKHVSSDEMKRTADRIVGKLSRSIKGGAGN
jgi:hypothetical protein